MNIQNYLLCSLYIFLIIAHSYTVFQKDFNRTLISIFSFALFTQTISTVLFTIHQTILTYGQQLIDLTNINPSSANNIQYFAQLIHVTSINFFILFLLIVAKGWPITRRDMPFKYAFITFWVLCLSADLITFYWSTITFLAKGVINNNQNNNGTTILTNNGSTTITHILITSSIVDSTTTTTIPTTLLESLPNDTEQFNSTPRRLSLLLRIIIMIYFLLELRATMILEQEQKKLQFYLHFGALSMVWFVHSLIVYVISLRVEAVWQSKLISGFSSAANFLAFAVTTRLLWPQNSKSYLFRKQKRFLPGERDATANETSNVNSDDDDGDEYDGLEMRDLNENKYTTHDDNHNLSSNQDLPTIRLEPEQSS